MDIEKSLQDIVRAAGVAHQPLTIVGTGAKAAWLGQASDVSVAQSLSLADYTGIIEYQPAELVVTARAGTRLKDLNLELGQRNQEIAADPPLLQGNGTLGGAIGAGFSGPGRPWLGSLRDAVLGVKILNGRGELLNFGGQVMKNVAGYDIARLMTGSMGSLGPVMEVSVRVRPRADHELTLAYEVDAQTGIELCRSIATQPLPVTGTFWSAGQLLVRFGGSEAGLHAAQAKLGGEVYDAGDIWRQIRDHRHDFFRALSVARRLDEAASAHLFCVVTPPAAPLSELGDGELAIEWGGGRRWLWHSELDVVHDYAVSVGGWVWQVGHAVGLAPMEKLLMQKIKRSFDPNGIFVSPTQVEGSYAD